MSQLTCKRCEKLFTPRNKRNTHYCSRACSDQQTIAVCYCKTCNKRFQSRHIKKYCSDDCNPAYQTLDLPIRKCPSCSKEYKPRFKKQRYCTTACNPYRSQQSHPFHQTKTWKELRVKFINGYTLIDGIELSNKYCIECYKQHNRLNDMHTVDHIVRIKDGGSETDHSNLQSLCLHHHQSKSAKEGNALRKGEKRKGRGTQRTFC